MVKVLIVYYSRSGNTASMAECVAEGVRKVEGVSVEVRKVADAKVDDLLQANAIILGSPVYYGGMAAELKKFIDESIKYHRKLAGRLGAAFSSSGAEHGGNETTVLDILKAFLVHGMIVSGDAEADHYGAIAVGTPDERAKNSCRRLGERTARLAAKLFD